MPSAPLLLDEAVAHLASLPADGFAPRAAALVLAQPELLLTPHVQEIVRARLDRRPAPQRSPLEQALASALGRARARLERPIDEVHIIACSRSWQEMLPIGPHTRLCQGCDREVEQIFTLDALRQRAGRGCAIFTPDPPEPERQPQQRREPPGPPDPREPPRPGGLTPRPLPGAPLPTAGAPLPRPPLTPPTPYEAPAGEDPLLPPTDDLRPQPPLVNPGLVAPPLPDDDATASDDTPPDSPSLLERLKSLMFG